MFLRALSSLLHVWWMTSCLSKGRLSRIMFNEDLLLANCSLGRAIDPQVLDVPSFTERNTRQRHMRSQVQ